MDVLFAGSPDLVVIEDLEGRVTYTNRRGELPEGAADARRRVLVRAEFALVVSVVQNLLSNAIKFRGAAAPDIRIDATAEGGWVHVVVCDNGLGIPVPHRERIFEMFQRLHTDAPGTGIGLAICRKIVERHGGRIWVEGPTGPGTALHFTLPAAERRAAA